EFCEALTARFAALSPGRAVVLTAGRHIFSAGVDLLRVSEGGAPYIRKFLSALSTMLSTVFSHPGSCTRWRTYRRDRTPRRRSFPARSHGDHALRHKAAIFRLRALQRRDLSAARGSRARLGA